MPFPEGTDDSGSSRPPPEKPAHSRPASASSILDAFKRRKTSSKAGSQEPADGNEADVDDFNDDAPATQPRPPQPQPQLRYPPPLKAHPLPNALLHDNPLASNPVHHHPLPFHPTNPFANPSSTAVNSTSNDDAPAAQGDPTNPILVSSGSEGPPSPPDADTTNPSRAAPRGRQARRGVPAVLRRSAPDTDLARLLRSTRLSGPAELPQEIAVKDFGAADDDDASVPAAGCEDGDGYQGGPGKGGIGVITRVEVEEAVRWLDDYGEDWQEGGGVVKTRVGAGGGAGGKKGRWVPRVREANEAARIIRASCEAGERIRRRGMRRMVLAAGEGGRVGLWATDTDDDLTQRGGKRAHRRGQLAFQDLVNWGDPFPALYADLWSGKMPEGLEFDVKGEKWGDGEGWDGKTELKGVKDGEEKATLRQRAKRTIKSLSWAAGPENRFPSKWLASKAKRGKGEDQAGGGKRRRMSAGDAPVVTTPKKVRMPSLRVAPWIKDAGEKKGKTQEASTDSEDLPSIVIDAESWFDDMGGTDTRDKGKGRAPPESPSSSSCYSSEEETYVPPRRRYINTNFDEDGEQSSTAAARKGPDNPLGSAPPAAPTKRKHKPKPKKPAPAAPAAGTTSSSADCPSCGSTFASGNGPSQPPPLPPSSQPPPPSTTSTAPATLPAPTAKSYGRAATEHDPRELLRIHHRLGFKNPYALDFRGFDLDDRRCTAPHNSRASGEARGSLSLEGSSTDSSRSEESGSGGRGGGEGKGAAGGGVVVPVQRGVLFPTTTGEGGVGSTRERLKAFGRRVLSRSRRHKSE